MKMKKIFVLSILVSLTLLAQAQSLTVDNYTMNAGEKATISIQVSADQNNYVGSGLIVQLAEEFSIDSDADGHWVSTSSNVIDDHITRGSVNSKNRLRVAIYSPTNSLLDLIGSNSPSVGGGGQSGGGSGGREAPRRAPGEEEEDIPTNKDFCSMQVVAPIIPGSYLCKLTSIEYATSDYELVTMPDVSFTITVKQPGDVNGDGAVSIADVTALVNIILGKNLPANQGVADINGDGSVTIADVTALVNIILGKTGQ